MIIISYCYPDTSSERGYSIAGYADEVETIADAESYLKRPPAEVRRRVGRKISIAAFQDIEYGKLLGFGTLADVGAKAYLAVCEDDIFYRGQSIDDEMAANMVSLNRARYEIYKARDALRMAMLYYNSDYEFPFEAYLKMAMASAAVLGEDTALIKALADYYYGNNPWLDHEDSSLRADRIGQSVVNLVRAKDYAERTIIEDYQTITGNVPSAFDLVRGGKNLADILLDDMLCHML